MRTSDAAKNRAIESELRKEGLFSSTSAPWQQNIIDDFLSSLKFKKNARCLDAACGIGNNIETLGKYFANIAAFDQSQKAIEFAKKDNSKHVFDNLTFDIGSLENIPFADNNFDCVVCTEALEHVRDYFLVIDEIYRVTKAGGFVILSFQNHFNFSFVLKFFFEKLFHRNWDVWGTHGHTNGYENYLTCFQVRDCTKSKFKIMKELGADYINAWFSWIPFFYKNYGILNQYPLQTLGVFPVIKYFGMDYFMLLKKPLRR